jgi:hypothetical protein
MDTPYSSWKSSWLSKLGASLSLKSIKKIFILNIYSVQLGGTEELDDLDIIDTNVPHIN